jgi:hypothetical protein
MHWKFHQLDWTICPGAQTFLKIVFPVKLLQVLDLERCSDSPGASAPGPLGSPKAPVSKAPGPFGTGAFGIQSLLVQLFCNHFLKILTGVL